jgi:hypothetical protein
MFQTAILGQQKRWADMSNFLEFIRFANTLFSDIPLLLSMAGPQAGSI